MNHLQIEKEKMTFNTAFQMAWSHCKAVTPPRVLQPGVCVVAVQVTLKHLFPTTRLSWIQCILYELLIRANQVEFQIVKAGMELLRQELLQTQRK